MKKFILSCFIFLAGVICAIGWVIACASKVAGGVSVVLGCVRGIDWAFIIVFSVISLLGLLSAIVEIRKDK